MLTTKNLQLVDFCSDSIGREFDAFEVILFNEDFENVNYSTYAHGLQYSIKICSVYQVNKRIPYNQNYKEK